MINTRIKIKGNSGEAKQTLTQGSITRHILRLALPLILGNILQQMYNTIDILVIGRYAGRLEYAAVGAASSIMNLLLFAVVGACTGMSIIFSQLYGAGQDGRFRTEHFTALAFGGGAAVLLGVAATALLPFLLDVTRTPVEIREDAAIYLRVVLAGLPFAFIYNLYGAILRSVGNTGASLYILAFSVVLNLGLDLLLVAWMGMGAAGAALATVAAQAISALSSMLWFNHLFPGLKCRREDCRADRQLLKQTIHFSAVTAVHQSSLYLGKMMVQSAVNSAGTEMIAAYTAAVRIEGFANSFGDSGAAATSVITAQNQGAGNGKRVRACFAESFVILLTGGILCSAILYASAGGAVAIVLGESAGVTVQQATSYLKTVALFYVFCFTGNTFAGWLDGIGRVSFPFLGAAGHISLRVILSWCLIGDCGLPGVAWATGIGWVLVNLFWGIHVKRKELGAFL